MSQRKAQVIYKCIKHNEGSKQHAETEVFKLRPEEGGVSHVWCGGALGERGERQKEGAREESWLPKPTHRTWSTQNPEGSQMPRASRVELQGKGAVVCRARSWEALWTLIKSIRSV